MFECDFVVKNPNFQLTRTFVLYLRLQYRRLYIEVLEERDSGGRDASRIECRHQVARENGSDGSSNF